MHLLCRILSIPFIERHDFFQERLPIFLSIHQPKIMIAILPLKGHNHPARRTDIKTGCRHYAHSTPDSFFPQTRLQPGPKLSGAMMMSCLFFSGSLTSFDGQVDSKVECEL